VEHRRVVRDAVRVEQLFEQPAVIDVELVVRAIGAWQRRIARTRGLVAPRTGAVSFASASVVWTT
jgi:hypothetical protein